MQTVATPPIHGAYSDPACTNAPDRRRPRWLSPSICWENEGGGLYRTQEVDGSIPFSSTTLEAARTRLLAGPYHPDMSQGSTGNVIAALVSFFIPGLGQLIQGRVLAALGFFILSGILWIFFLGWIGHVLATIDAAIWKPKS
jgi:TM2 domain-containing membrane protein YozV